MILRDLRNEFSKPTNQTGNLSDKQMEILHDSLDELIGLKKPDSVSIQGLNYSSIFQIDINRYFNWECFIMKAI